MTTTTTEFQNSRAILLERKKGAAMLGRESEEKFSSLILFGKSLFMVGIRGQN